MAGAEGGTVDVYARGTTTPITLYTDFEGTVTTSNPATLDSNGRAKLYVDQYARCLVKNSSGSTVLDFVDGYDANGVEVRSASIIGNAYVGGAAAAGNPISVEAALNKLITSFGSTDFNVLLAGSSVALQTALGYLWRARVFDVKAYGALGDGATNDLNAINSAASAANTAGGGVVFFPPGTYNISTSLTLYSTVEYVGVSSTLSIIKATSDFVTFTGTTMPLAVRRLGFSFSGSMSTWLTVSSGSASVLFEDCAFANTSVATGGGGGMYHNGTGTVRFVRCTMGVTAGDTRFLAVYANGEMALTDCRITFYTTGYQGYVGYGGGSSTSLARLTLIRCTIDSNGGGSGGRPAYGIWVNDYGVLRMQHCTSFANSGSSSAQSAIFMGGTTEAYVYEDGNDFSYHYAQIATTSTHGPYNRNAAGACSGSLLGTRTCASLPALLPNGATITVPISQARTVIIRTTSGSGTRAINADSWGSNGEHAVLMVHNDTGSSITYQWATLMASSGSTFAVAANSVRVFGLAFDTERGKWFIISDLAGAETAE